MFHDLCALVTPFSNIPFSAIKCKIFLEDHSLASNKLCSSWNWNYMYNWLKFQSNTFINYCISTMTKIFALQMSNLFRQGKLREQFFKTIIDSWQKKFSTESVNQTNTISSQIVKFVQMSIDWNPSISTLPAILHISLVPWCVGLDRFHCKISYKTINNIQDEVHKLLTYQHCIFLHEMHLMFEVQ